MRVVLELTGFLSWYAPGQVRELELEVDPGTTIQQACYLANLPNGDVAMAIVNGEQRRLDDPVQAGQRISLIPPISGG